MANCFLPREVFSDPTEDWKAIFEHGAPYVEFLDEGPSQINLPLAIDRIFPVYAKYYSQYKGVVKAAILYRFRYASGYYYGYTQCTRPPIGIVLPNVNNWGRSFASRSLYNLIRQAVSKDSLDYLLFYPRAAPFGPKEYSCAYQALKLPVFDPIFIQDAIVGLRAIDQGGSGLCWVLIEILANEGIETPIERKSYAR